MFSTLPTNIQRNYILFHRKHDGQQNVQTVGNSIFASMRSPCCNVSGVSMDSWILQRFTWGSMWETRCVCLGSSFLQVFFLTCTCVCRCVCVCSEQVFILQCALESSVGSSPWFYRASRRSLSPPPQTAWWTCDSATRQKQSLTKKMVTVKVK